MCAWDCRRLPAPLPRRLSSDTAPCRLGAANGYIKAAKRPLRRDNAFLKEQPALQCWQLQGLFSEYLAQYSTYLFCSLFHWWTRDGFIVPFYTSKGSITVSFISVCSIDIYVVRTLLLNLQLTLVSLQLNFPFFSLSHLDRSLADVNPVVSGSAWDFDPQGTFSLPLLHLAWSGSPVVVVVFLSLIEQCTFRHHWMWLSTGKIIIIKKMNWLTNYTDVSQSVPKGLAPAMSCSLALALDLTPPPRLKILGWEFVDLIERGTFWIRFRIPFFVVLPCLTKSKVQFCYSTQQSR